MTTEKTIYYQIGWQLQMKFILGLKIKMSQIFDEHGRIIPVTFIKAGPCRVTRVKKKEKDGYEAVQVGIVSGKGVRVLKEFKGRDLKIKDYQPKKEIDVSDFKEGDKVLISGVSKGKGFAGVVKRWGFAGKNTSHGTKHEVRTPGSVGAMTPSRVIKGRKLPGRMGGKRITVKGIKVVKIDKEKNILAVKGAVPGRRGTLLEIRG